MGWAVEVVVVPAFMAAAVMAAIAGPMWILRQADAGRRPKLVLSAVLAAAVPACIALGAAARGLPAPWRDLVIGAAGVAAFLLAALAVWCLVAWLSMRPQTGRPQTGQPAGLRPAAPSRNYPAVAGRRPTLPGPR